MATSNAATTYLERRILDYLFKNDSLSFASPGDSIYIGLATAVSNAEKGNLTEVSVASEDANYVRQQITAANWKQSVTTLGQNADASQTYLALTDAEAFPTSGTVSINDEIITYTGKDTTATANVNGAVSSSTSIAVDGVSGTIAEGMVVTGTGISGTVRVTAFSSPTVTVDTAVTLSDDVALTFDGTSILTGCTRGTSSTTAAAHTAGDTVISDQQQVINDGNVEWSASSGIASYTVTHAFVSDAAIGVAVVNGAVSGSTSVALDGNTGATISVGDIVYNTGASTVVRVAGVTSQASITLDTTVTIADDTKLWFDGGNTMFIGALDASKTIASGDIFRINATNLSIELK